MKKIQINVENLEVFKETFLRSGNEVSVPIKYLDNLDEIATGEHVEIEVIVKKTHRNIELAGEVKWKRTKSINIPGKKIPAGVGIKFDDVSMEVLKLHFKELARELSAVGGEMVGGNYIRVRSDIAEKYNMIKKKHDDFSEKRAQPRISLNLQIELFINGVTKKFTTSDISLLGMKILSEEKLPVGEEVLVLFEDLSAKKQFMLKAVILRNIKGKGEPPKNAAAGIKFIFENETQKKELMKFIVRKS